MIMFISASDTGEDIITSCTVYQSTWDGSCGQQTYVCLLAISFTSFDLPQCLRCKSSDGARRAFHGVRCCLQRIWVRGKLDRECWCSMTRNPLKKKTNMPLRNENVAGTCKATANTQGTQQYSAIHVGGLKKKRKKKERKKEKKTLWESCMLLLLQHRHIYLVFWNRG